MMTQFCRGVPAALAILTGVSVLGCASQPAVSGGPDTIEVFRNVADPAQASVATGVRIDAIQRIDSDTEDAVTGIVTVRNVSNDPRTVKLGVTWVTLPDAANRPTPGVSQETLLLAPRESRDVVFRGERGTRDFKVAMNSIGR